MPKQSKSPAVQVKAGEEPTTYWQFPKLADLKVGDKLEAGGGFTCMREGEIKTVFESRGELCVSCDEGDHSLAGQLGYRDGDIGQVIGLRRVGP